MTNVGHHLSLENECQKFASEGCQKEITRGWPIVVVEKMVIRSWPLVVEYGYRQTLKNNSQRWMIAVAKKWWSKVDRCWSSSFTRK